MIPEQLALLLIKQKNHNKRFGEFKFEFEYFGGSKSRTSYKSILQLQLVRWDYQPILLLDISKMLPLWMGELWQEVNFDLSPISAVRPVLLWIHMCWDVHLWIRGKKSVFEWLTYSDFLIPHQKLCIIQEDKAFPKLKIPKNVNNTK